MVRGTIQFFFFFFLNHDSVCVYIYTENFNISAQNNYSCPLPLSLKIYKLVHRI